MRAPPCIWTFLSSLRKSDFFSILLGARVAACDGGAQAGARRRALEAGKDPPRERALTGC